MASNPPKVLISYSHDSQEHKDRVLGLSNRLREEGIDCTIDHDSELRQAFPDGIYWLTVGQKPNLLDLQNQLLRQLTGSKEALITEQEAKDALRKTLEGRTARIAAPTPEVSGFKGVSFT